MQFFIAVNYLILMSEKYLHFRKREKHMTKNFFSNSGKVSGSMYFGNIFWLMCIYRCKQKLERNWNNSEFLSKLAISLNV